MADATDATNPSTLTTTDIIIIDNEPRVTDVKLATALGYADVKDLRALANRHREPLERFGGISAHRASKIGRGRPSEGMAFNKKQALYLGGKTDLPAGVEMLIAMVEVFDAATSPTNPQPSLALPPPSSEPCPPFCDGCWARKQWLTGENTIHNPNPLVDAPLDCADLRMLATLRPLVARTVRLQIGNRILDATIAMQNALSGKDDA